MKKNLLYLSAYAALALCAQIAYMLRMYSKNDSFLDVPDIAVVCAMMTLIFWIVVSIIYLREDNKEFEQTLKKQINELRSNRHNN